MQGCKACQNLKRNKKQYGKLTPKEIESNIMRKSNKTILIHAERRRLKISNDNQKRKHHLFTGSHYDRPSYRLDRNSGSTLCLQI